MTDPAIPSPEEPMKPRALTYTEMMNGGRQQMDEAEHVREQQLQQRVADLEKDVDWLEKSLKGGIESASPWYICPKLILGICQESFR